MLFGFVGLLRRRTARGRDRRAGPLRAAAVSRESPIIPAGRRRARSRLERTPEHGRRCRAQLALALDHAEKPVARGFPGRASQRGGARADRALAGLAGARCLLLSGPPASGKSHLRRDLGRDEAGARVAVGARRLQRGDVPGALATGALVLEDCGPGAFDERALFHLLNLAREQEGLLLLTARRRPAMWDRDTADLVSRLRAVPRRRGRAPDDALLRAVLVKLFVDRQLVVDESLVDVSR